MATTASAPPPPSSPNCWWCPSCKETFETRATCVAHLVDNERWNALDAVTWSENCAAAMAPTSVSGERRDSDSVASVYTMASEGSTRGIITSTTQIRRTKSNASSMRTVTAKPSTEDLGDDAITPTPQSANDGDGEPKRTLSFYECEVAETDTMKRSPGRNRSRDSHVDSSKYDNERGINVLQPSTIANGLLQISLRDLDEKIVKLVDDAMRRGGRQALNADPQPVSMFASGRSSTAPLRSSLKAAPKIVTIVSPQKLKTHIEFKSADGLKVSPPTIPPRPSRFSKCLTPPASILVQATKSSPPTANFFQHRDRRYETDVFMAQSSTAQIEFPLMSRELASRPNSKQPPKSTSDVRATIDDLLEDADRFLTELTNTGDPARHTVLSGASSINHLELLIDAFLAESEDAPAKNPRLSNVASAEAGRSAGSDRLRKSDSARLVEMEFIGGVMKDSVVINRGSRARVSRLTARPSVTAPTRQRSRLRERARPVNEEANDLLRDLDSFIVGSQKTANLAHAHRNDHVDEGYGSSPTTNSISLDSTIDSDWKNHRGVKLPNQYGTIGRGPAGIAATFNNRGVKKHIPRRPPPPSLTQLPSSILRRVFSHLHPHDVIRLQRLSKAGTIQFPNPRTDGTFSVVLLNNFIASDGRAALRNVRWDRLGVRPCAALITLLNLTPSTLALMQPEFRSLSKPLPRPMQDISFIVEALAIALAESSSSDGTLRKARLAGVPTADARAADFFALRWLAVVDEPMLLTKLLSGMRPRPPQSLYSDILKIAVVHPPNVPLIHHLLAHASKHAISTAFVSSAATNNTQTLSVLLSHPSVNPLTQSNAAIRIACARGHTDAVRLLISDKRVDPFALHGEDVIRVATERGHKDVVRLLNAWLAEKGHGYVRNRRVGDGTLTHQQQQQQQQQPAVVANRSRLYANKDVVKRWAGAVGIESLVGDGASVMKKPDGRLGYNEPSLPPSQRVVAAAAVKDNHPERDVRDLEWEREVERRRKDGENDNGRVRGRDEFSRRRREDLEWLRSVLERREAEQQQPPNLSAEAALSRREAENLAVMRGGAPPAAELPHAFFHEEHDLERAEKRREAVDVLKATVEDRSRRAAAAAERASWRRHQIEEDPRVVACDILKEGERMYRAADSEADYWAQRRAVDDDNKYTLQKPRSRGTGDDSVRRKEEDRARARVRERHLQRERERAIDREREREAEKLRERRRELEDAREVDRLRQLEWERQRRERSYARRFGIAGGFEQMGEAVVKVNEGQIGGAGNDRDHWRTNIYAL